MASSKLYAIIAGVGPGAGASIARKFAEAYAVILLARNTANLEPIAQEITANGGTAISLEGDVTKRETIMHALEVAQGTLGADSTCAAAIFNASARPAFKSFLDLSEEEFVGGFNVSCLGGFHFAQAVIPKLLDTSGQAGKYSPTLIYTGATASLRGGKMLSSFAVAKTATRTMTQSIAREFGSKGLHVSHVIIDGVINIPADDGKSKEEKAEGKIDPETIADTYWYLHTQPQSGFTHELEIRPSAEKW